MIISIFPPKKTNQNFSEISGFLEGRKLFLNTPNQIAENFSQIDSNQDGKITDQDQLFSGKNATEKLQIIAQKVSENLTQFFDTVSPEGKEKGNLDKVKNFQASVNSRLPNLREHLPAGQATEFFQEYMSVFENFSGIEKDAKGDEKNRKNGGIMERSRIHSIPSNVQNTEKYPEISLVSGKSEISDFLKKEFITTQKGIEDYKNASVLSLGNGKNIVFKTGIVEMKPIVTNGITTGFTVLDGDGDLSQYNMGKMQYVDTQKLSAKNSQKNVAASATLSAVGTVNEEYSGFAEITSSTDKKNLFAAASTKLFQKFQESMKAGKQVDWEDWNDTVFYEKDGEIWIDMTEQDNGFDRKNKAFLSKKDLSKFSGFSGKNADEKAENMAKFLNKNRELLGRELPKNPENSQKKACPTPTIERKKAPQKAYKNMSPLEKKEHQGKVVDSILKQEGVNPEDQKILADFVASMEPILLRFDSNSQLYHGIIEMEKSLKGKDTISLADTKSVLEKLKIGEENSFTDSEISQIHKGLQALWNARKQELEKPEEEVITPIEETAIVEENEENNTETEIELNPEHVSYENKNLITEVFTGQRSKEKVAKLQKFLGLNQDKKYGSETHNALLDFVKKHSSEFPEELRGAVKMRDEIRKNVHSYEVTKETKEKLRYTSRVPKNSEISQAKNRLEQSQNWNKFFLKLKGKKGVLVDTQTHTAYIVSGSKNNPVFHTAYTITLGENGVGQGQHKTPSGIFNGSKRKSKKKIGEVLMYTDHDKRPYGTSIPHLNKQDAASMVTEVITLTNDGVALHGTNHEKTVGKNMSHGCIRFTNSDIINLVGQTGGTPTVWIAPSKNQSTKHGMEETHLYKLY